jgi:hypothetical protein
MTMMRRMLIAIAALGLAACSSSDGAGDGGANGDLAGPDGDGGMTACGDCTQTPLGLLPDTTDGIHLFADQLPSGYSDTLVRFAATHYAGTQKMLKAENDRYRAVNPNWLLLHYRLGASSGPVQYIHDNQWSSDWTDVTSHEDWFMHNESNQRHHDSGSDWDINDPTSTGFRDYWVSSVIADMRATGALGVFADSFEAGISGYGVTPPDVRFDATNPANPSVWANGVDWLSQKQDWIAFVTAAFAKEPEHFLFVPNIGAMITGWADIDYSGVDGAMLESFGFNLAPSDWVLGMNRAMRLSRAGKFIILQSYPDSVASRQFLLATYLLLKGNHTFVNLAGSGVVYFPEYAIDFGAPAAALPSDVSGYLSNGVYRRDFAKGIVLVNPGDTSVMVTLPSTMQQVSASGGGPVDDTQIDAMGNYTGGSLSYAPVSTVTLASKTAALLLFATP